MCVGGGYRIELQVLRFKQLYMIKGEGGVFTTWKCCLFPWLKGHHEVWSTHVAAYWCGLSTGTMGPGVPFCAPLCPVWLPGHWPLGGSHRTQLLLVNDLVFGLCWLYYVHLIFWAIACWDCSGSQLIEHQRFLRWRISGPSWANRQWWMIHLLDCQMIMLDDAKQMSYATIHVLKSGRLRYPCRMAL